MVGPTYPTAVIFRSSVFSKINVLALAAAALLVAVTTGAPALLIPELRGQPWPIVGVVFLIGLFAILGFVFAKMEVTFDGHVVTLAFSFIRKRIPLEAITGADATEVTFWEAGGSGIHYGFGRARWIAGPGPIIRITTPKIVYWASCQNAERLIALMEQYRGATFGAKR